MVAEIWLEKIFLILKSFPILPISFSIFLLFHENEKKRPRSSFFSNRETPPIQVSLSKHHQKSSLFFIWKNMKPNMALYIQRSLGPLGLAMLENLMVLNHLGLRKRFLGMLKSLLARLMEERRCDSLTEKTIQDFNLYSNNI